MIISDCSGLPTLTTLGLCILNGLNGTLTTTQGNYGSLVLGGLSTSFLMANGSSLASATYPTVSSLPVSLTWRSNTGTSVNATANVVCIRKGTATAGTLSYTFDMFTITNSITFSYILSTTGVPVPYRPLTQQSTATIINNGSSWVAGVVMIQTDGVIVISASGFTNLPASTAVGFNSNKITISLAYGS